MKIHEVCRRTGLSQKTVRFYEAQGLITPAAEERNGKVWRDYSETDVARLAVVSELRRALFPIAEIGQMLNDPREVPELLSRHRVKIEKMYTELGELRTALEQAERKRPEGAAELAAAIAESGAEMPLPALDLAPRFKELDEEELKRIPPPPKPARPKIFTKGVLVFAAVVMLASLLLAVVQWRRISSFEYEGETFRRVERQEGRTYDLSRYQSKEGSEFLVYDRSLSAWDPRGYALVQNYSERRAETVALAESLGETRISGEDPERTIAYLVEGECTRADGEHHWFVLLCTQSNAVNSSGDSSVLKLYADGKPLGAASRVLSNKLLLADEKQSPQTYKAIALTDEAAEITFALLRGADTRMARSIFSSTLIAGLVVILLVIGARVLVPSIMGTSSKNKGERMAGYALLYGAGNVAMGARGTVHEQVHGSPMEASMTLREEEEKDRK